MLVTFIIIAYNAEKYLKDSLDSLKKQSYQHDKIEVILVDSMSTDNTKAIFNDFKEKNKDFNRIVILENSKKTLPCGWNVALKQAKGEAILRVDAHTLFDTNFITNNVNELEKGENIVGGKCITITKNNSKVEQLLLIAEESIFGCGIATFRRKSEREYVSTLAFAMYRKKVFDEVGEYNEKLARTEDNEMHYRMKQKGYKFLLSPNIISYRYARSDFKSMIKQKYSNGKWIGITMKYCPKCFSVYHFIPLFFVLAIILTIMMAILGIKIPFYILLLAYTLFNILNLLIVFKNKGLKIEYLALPFLLFILHVSYGTGTIIGLLKPKNKKYRI